MTTEENFRQELLARRAALRQQIKTLNEQLAAIDVMLAATAPSVTNEATLPTAPAIPPVPETRLSTLGRKRGWLMERIEQLIDQGGPTFTLDTIFEAYRAKWGWKRYPSKSSIGATIWKIVRKRRHTILARGTGRRSSTYQKAPAPLPGNK